jgi:hypothetical protein
MADSPISPESRQQMEEVLRAAPIPDEAKAAAWDQFALNGDVKQFKTAFDKIDGLPNAVKLQLAKIRFGLGPSAPPEPAKTTPDKSNVGPKQEASKIGPPSGPSTNQHAVRDQLKGQGFLSSAIDSLMSAPHLIKDFLTGEDDKKEGKLLTEWEEVQRIGTKEQKREKAKEILLQTVPFASTVYKATHGNISGAAGDVVGLAPYFALPAMGRGGEAKSSGAEVPEPPPEIQKVPGVREPPGKSAGPIRPPLAAKPAAPPEPGPVGAGGPVGPSEPPVPKPAPPPEPAKAAAPEKPPAPPEPPPAKVEAKPPSPPIQSGGDKAFEGKVSKARAMRKSALPPKKAQSGSAKPKPSEKPTEPPSPPSASAQVPPEVGEAVNSIWQTSKTQNYPKVKISFRNVAGSEIASQVFDIGTDPAQVSQAIAQIPGLRSMEITPVDAPGPATKWHKFLQKSFK